VRDNRENSVWERNAKFKGANNASMANLWNPPLDHADLWIYRSSYTPLLTDRRDLKAHNLFERNHHRKFPGN
jgi:hypothetical protein